uniref:Uncharacterized protein n=1 Tax=Anguilla anguilla TaxID=7936 RepID=A0A0E9TZN7_ANGAN
MEGHKVDCSVKVSVTA